MKTFRYRFETRGERLYGFLRDLMARSLPQEGFEQWLEPMGRSPEWIEYFEQLSAVALTGRVVAAGRSLAREYRADRLLFRREFRSYLGESFLVKKELDDLIEYAIPAVEVAGREIPGGL